jgi:predicted AAA+ superfamily ATPase
MVEISKIIEQNPWWKGIDFPWYSFDEKIREYENAIFKTRRNFSLNISPNNIYTISGPRQVGKTTYIKLLIKNFILKKGFDPKSICYFSCDTLTSNSRKELRKVLDYFIERLQKFRVGYIFLDEVSYVKDWSIEIKNLADSGKLENICLIVTGSPLGVKEIEYLPGRKIEGNRYFFKPLTFRDFILSLDIDRYVSPNPEVIESILKLKKILRTNFLTLEEDFEKIKEKVELLIPYKNELDFLFDFYLRTGGFPFSIENYLREKKVEKKCYETIINIILSDLGKRGRSENIGKQILNAIVKRLGTAYDFRAISRDTEEGISVDTVINYLELFENSFLIKILYSYDFNKKQKRIKGNKKIYFTDPFLFYSILSWLEGKNGFDITEEILSKEEKLSYILESIVLSTLEKTKEIPIIKKSDSFLWFYYDKKEIDFVFKKDSGKFIGIEVKYRPEVSEKDVYKIKEVKNYIILSKDSFEIGEDTIVVPITVFLSLIKSSDYHL